MSVFIGKNKLPETSQGEQSEAGASDERGEDFPPDPHHLKLEKLPNGLSIYHQSAVQTNIIYGEVFEVEVYLQHGITLRDGACIFDVGAHIGLFSLYAHLHCKNARIYAFEPGPGSFAALSRNIKKYSIDAELFNSGLSSEPKQAPYLFFPHMSGMSGLFADVEREKKAFKVGVHHWLEESGNKDGEALRQELEDLIDTFFSDSQWYTSDFQTLSHVMDQQRIENIDLLKIDAEGSELAILQGIHSSDWPKIKQIVAEVHNITLLREVSQLLADHGYDVTIEVEESAALDEFEKNDGYRLYMLYAIRHERVDGGSHGEIKYVLMHRHNISSTTLSHMLRVGESQNYEERRL